jgi:hypothetical protein
MLRRTSIGQRRKLEFAFELHKMQSDRLPAQLASGQWATKAQTAQIYV